MVEKYVVGCYGLVFDGGNLLMVKPESGLWANKWTLPGGTLRTGDSLENCIEKEIQEKTSCRVKAKRQLLTIPYNISGSIFERHIVIVFYVCKLTEKPPAVNNDNSIRWMNNETFKKMYGSGLIPAQVQYAVAALCPEKNMVWQQSSDLTYAGAPVNGSRLVQAIKTARQSQNA